MRIIFLFLLLLITGISIYAQQIKESERLIKFTKADSLYFESLPKLYLSDQMKTRSLPYAIDNSQLPYFRPMYEQFNLECGQASSVGLCFTYEINAARGVPGNVTDNQYTAHFAYNFQNNSYNTGVTYFKTFEILKYGGVPNVTEYGGMEHGYLHWMTGYDKYYHAMHNRAVNAYSIDVSDEEGLEVLKNWIYDHCDGSSEGGVAVFYAQSPWGMLNLPNGTEEAGKYIHINWGSVINHAMTIVGYNDSIRYDYNNDGQYTNDIDINGDGKVNMQDWEIGGLKFCNTYGGGPTWGDGGYCYMLYKSLADDYNTGIWNHAVHVIKAKANCEPQLTFKVGLQYIYRCFLKVTIGVANDTSATEPEYVLDLPVFDYQGGLENLQANGLPSGDTIEFGLDATPLLNYINNNDHAKFFLIVDEDDPSGYYNSGEILHFSVIDYTSGVPEEIIYSPNSTPLINDDETVLGLSKYIDYNEVDILPNSLPTATIYQNYNYQMTAIGGTSPYTWDINILYNKTEISESLPMVTANPVSVNTDGFYYLDLPFSFPFYDQSYDRIAIKDEGSIFLEGGLSPWPYYSETKPELFYRFKVISPLYSDALNYSSADDGIWYESYTDSLIIRWDVTFGGNDAEFAVGLFPNGDIKYYYGNFGSYSNNYMVGLSEGDYLNCLVFNETLADLEQKSYLIAYPNYPKGLKIRTDGLLHGTLNEPYYNSPLQFVAIDQNGIKNPKTLYITTDGIVIDYIINAGSNGIIEYGETVSMDIILTNTYATSVDNTFLTLSENDPLISISDNYESVGTLAPYTQDTFQNAFSFVVDNNIPDNYDFDLSIDVESNGNNWGRQISLSGRAPDIQVLSYFVDDGNNNRLDPGETANVYVDYINSGGADAYNVNINFLSNDTNILITSFNPIIIVFEHDSVKTLMFIVTADSTAPVGYVAQVLTTIDADYNYSNTGNIYVGIGLIVENFESGDLTAYSWYTSGNANWYMDTVTVYENSYSVRSGNISHDQISSLKLAVEFLNNGYMKFYRKVSCEDGPTQNYDYLSLFIDNLEQYRWDGELDWTLDSFYLDQGIHLIEWRYTKDYSISSGSDAAWIDYITFPEIYDTVPTLHIFPDSLIKYMFVNEVDTDTVIISNIGGGIIDYNVIVDYSTAPAPIIKNIAGSYIECTNNQVSTGVPLTLNLEVYNGSTDSEWLKDLYINFPIGVYLDSASNFIGGSGGEMVYDGTSGDDITVNWHGEDGNGWGNIHEGETASAQVYLQIDTNITTDIHIPYTIMGDTYGSTPHTIVGDFVLSNIGQQQNWVSLINSGNSIIMNNSQELLVVYNTNGMSPGTYYCELLVQNSVNNTVILPVTLHVYNPTDINFHESLTISAYPNPFNESVVINVSLNSMAKLKIDIYDQAGRKIKSVINENYYTPGDYHFHWNGTNDRNDLVKSGIYYYQVSVNDQKFSDKIIFVNQP